MTLLAEPLSWPSFDDFDLRDLRFRFGATAIAVHDHVLADAVFHEHADVRDSFIE